jgi:hypothetical protein
MREKFYCGVEMSFFKNIVLPSVELPKKGTYTIQETLVILDCSRTSLYRKVKRGDLTLTPDKRIYLQDLINYFDRVTTEEEKERNNET